MALPSITTRSAKGSALTFSEADDNFTNLRDAVISVTDGVSSTDINLNSAITFAAGTGISVSESNGTITVTNTVSDTDTTNFNIGDGSTSFNVSDSETINIAQGSGIGVSVNTGTNTLTISNTQTPGIANVVEDTTPQLGGELDGQGNTVSNVNMKDYKETVYALTYGATLTPDAVNGNVQKTTLTGNLEINGFSNAETGQSITIILAQDATGNRTFTTTMKMAGGDSTLSTAANAIDILTIFYDGTNYYGSLAKNFS